MNGLNQLFAKDPENFMEKFLIDLCAFSKLQGTGGTVSFSKGVYDFDLYQTSKVVRLRLADEIPKDCVEKSSPLRGYWLPWELSDTTVIQLGTKADFFFTSSLTGCRLQIAPGGRFGDGTKAPWHPDYPWVLHVAGNGYLSGTKEGSDLREESVQKRLAPEQFKRSRRFSSLQDYKKSGAATVIGYRRMFWKGWCFIAQGSGAEDQVPKIVALSEGDKKNTRVIWDGGPTFWDF